MALTRLDPTTKSHETHITRFETCLPRHLYMIRGHERQGKQSAVKQGRRSVDHEVANGTEAYQAEWHDMA